MWLNTKGENIILNDYGASILSKNIRPYELEVIKYKYRNMITTSFVKTYTSPYLLEIEILINRQNHDETFKQLARIIPLFHQCKFELTSSDGLAQTTTDGLEYSCILNSYDFEFVTMNEVILRLALETEIYSEEKSGKVNHLTESIFIDGSRETRINFEIHANETLTNFAINDFIIKKLQKGKSLIINSVDGLITVDGSLYSKRENISFNTFMQGVGEFKLAISNADADVFYSYKGRW